jgi:hypothetical protein
MSSRFVNLFKKDDLDEQRAFQRRVHGMVSKLYPDRIFSLGDDPLKIESDETVYGLSNLHAKFLLTDQTAATLEMLIREQFDGVFRSMAPAAKDLPWEEARNYLMPQLMPVDFVQMAPVELVHRPFVDGVLLGLVIDSESSYQYVNAEGRDEWGIEVDEIFKAAFENLHQRSQGIDMMAFPGENGFFIVSTRDGFDAVRLLSPEMRNVVAEHIGSPFFAGVPNRDFLICWSAKGDAEFQGKMRQQISSDFDEQPYPLCRHALDVSSDGEIEIAAASKPDARAANADLN